jgi:hypothetical protein
LHEGNGIGAVLQKSELAGWEKRWVEGAKFAQDPLDIRIFY